MGKKLYHLSNDHKANIAKLVATEGAKRSEFQLYSELHGIPERRVLTQANHYIRLFRNFKPLSDKHKEIHDEVFGSYGFTRDEIAQRHGVKKHLIPKYLMAVDDHNIVKRYMGDYIVHHMEVAALERKVQQLIASRHGLQH